MEKTKEILKKYKKIALVGASKDLTKTSSVVMKYLQKYGFKVYPVNPSMKGEEILGEKVFGSISEKTKIQNVRTAEASATAPDPYRYNTWAPIPAAPKVCEMVFKVNIAANGRLISSFSFCNIYDLIHNF